MNIAFFIASHLACVTPFVCWKNTTFFVSFSHYSLHSVSNESCRHCENNSSNKSSFYYISVMFLTSTKTLLAQQWRTQGFVKNAGVVFTYVCDSVFSFVVLMTEIYIFLFESKRQLFLWICACQITLVFTSLCALGFCKTTTTGCTIIISHYSFSFDILPCFTLNYIWDNVCYSLLSTRGKNILACARRRKVNRVSAP